MAEENKGTNEPKKGSGKSCLVVAGIILLTLAIIFGLYFGLAYILRKVNNQETGTTTTTETTKSSGKIDQNLVGEWDTGCLVPDPNSPWAEQHHFSIKSDGTAIHTRKSGETCAGLNLDNTDAAKMTVPAAGEINIAFTSGVAAGTTIYDIYQVSGNTLLFGHGFCNCTDAGSASGGATAGDRFNRLNTFLSYKKAQQKGKDEKNTREFA